MSFLFVLLFRKDRYAYIAHDYWGGSFHCLHRDECTDRPFRHFLRFLLECDCLSIGWHYNRTRWDKCIKTTVETSHVHITLTRTKVGLDVFPCRYWIDALHARRVYFEWIFIFSLSLMCVRISKPSTINAHTHTHSFRVKLDSHCFGSKLDKLIEMLFYYGYSWWMFVRQSFWSVTF